MSAENKATVHRWFIFWYFKPE